MKHILLFIVALLVLSFSTFGQNPNAKQLYATAKEFIKQGDYDNATLVLNNALKQEPYNFEMLKDLAFVNYLKRDFAESINVCKQIMDRPDVDEQVFQILGMNYKALAENKECAKMYKAALKKFPNSGIIYNEIGELMAADKNLPGAIEQWEKGIELAPSYSNNYFNATNFYASIGNLFKEIIYGEIFINLESYSTRTANVKALLLEAYKKIYASNNIQQQSLQYHSDFANRFFETLAKSKNLADDGITPEILTAIRARFIIDWFAENNQDKYPFRLFDHLQYLLREGMFEAYNEWIFATAANPSSYAAWINTYPKQAEAFKQFQQSRVFKLPLGQYYK